MRRVSLDVVAQRLEVAGEVGDGDAAEARLDARDAERDVRRRERILADDERARLAVEERAEAAPFLLPGGRRERRVRGAQGAASFTQ